VTRARLISPSSVCTRANADTSIWRPPCPSPASRRRAARARLYAACHGRFPAAEAASGLQFRISRVVGLVNQLANQAKKRENETRWQQKRNASVASHRSAPCGIALRGPFTPGTDEICRSRRVVSRRVRRALFLSLLAVCTRPNNITWIRSPRSMFCAISSRRTSHEYASGMPRAICGGGSSLGIAASDICPILPFFQSSNADQKLGMLTLRAAIGVTIGAIRQAAPCAKAFQCPFTPGTGKLRSTRRLASRRVRRARF
jgi:hypothetical protein